MTGEGGARSLIGALERFALDLLLTLVKRGALSRSEALELLADVAADLKRSSADAQPDPAARERVAQAIDALRAQLEGADDPEAMAASDKNVLRQ